MKQALHVPGPLIEVAIDAKSKVDRGRMETALARLAAEDPSFFVSIDTESGQVILGGISETHLDSKIDILKCTDKVDANIGAPQVAYRETLTRRVEQDYTHKKQIGGMTQFARVRLVFEPTDPGSGNVFASKIVGAVPKEYISGVEKVVN